MEITAKVLKVLPEKSGTSAKGNSWVSQEYLVENNGKKLLLRFFGEQRVREAQQLLQVGATAQFQFVVETRVVTKSTGEEMYFTSVDCLSFSIPQTQGYAPQAVQPQSVPVQPVPVANPAPVMYQEDDLPF